MVLTFSFQLSTLVIDYSSEIYMFRNRGVGDIYTKNKTRFWYVLSQVFNDLCALFLLNYLYDKKTRYLRTNNVIIDGSKEYWSWKKKSILTSLIKIYVQDTLKIFLLALIISNKRFNYIKTFQIFVFLEWLTNSKSIHRDWELSFLSYFFC